MIRPEYVPNTGWTLERARLATANRGLLLDKYFSPKKKDDKNGSLPQWRSLCDSSLTPSAYQLAYKRWVEHTQSWVTFKGTLRNRMAIGLGIENVHDIGCRLHTTYGVPVIPGSTLKGLLRAGLTKMPDYVDLIVPLFGHPEKGRGAIEVYDAWWVPSSGSGLAPDVITVHHQKYYSNQGDTAPQDRESPVPNHFLTVTGDFYFAFRILTEDEPAKWGTFIRDAAQSFLKTDGIGSKRSAGYGRFSKFT